MSNLTVGKIVNNSVTLVLSSSGAKTTRPTLADHTQFEVNLPNINGFPHKTRCLCQLQSVRTGGTSSANDRYIGCLGVDIPQMAPHNLYTDNGQSGLVGVVDQQFLSNIGATAATAGPGQTYTNHQSFLESSVLCQSPFGKRLTVTIKDMATNSRVTNHPAIIGKTIVVKLRLLFLDNEDLKDF